jgi:GNAT superfamily N-acetyltransferase
MDSRADKPGFRIRPATANDAAKIAGLLAVLGYVASREDVGRRLERLLGRPDRGVLLAEGDGGPIALASYQIIDLLEREKPQCRVTALVTDHAHRRQGAATALIGAVESIARDRGCFRLEVTTRPRRAGALEFYATHGFNERPYRLVKPLDGAPAGLGPEAA